MCSDLIYAGTDFKDYSNKAELYFKAVFKDVVYLILFWIVYVIILLFSKIPLKNHQMRKVILPVILIIIISCENKIVQEESNTTIDTARINQPKTAQINQNIVDQPKSISDSRYSFVVFVGEDFVSRNEKQLLPESLKLLLS